MNSSSRRWLPILVLPILAVAIVLQFQSLLKDPEILPIDDFVEYWAAGRLNVEGKNPYDAELLLPLERDTAGRKTDKAVMMWNPPWTLTLAMPFGLLDARTAQMIWLVISLILVVGSVDLLWRMYDGPSKYRWVAWLAAFTFMPTFFLLTIGQIGGFVLAGSVLFLYFQKRGWSYLAGAACVLLAIKPHLVYLFWISLIVWGIFRDRRLLIGGLVAGIVTTAIPFAFNPKVFEQYWYALSNQPPIEWMSPTLGTLIRMQLGEAKFGLTFLPTLLGIAWLVWHSNRHFATGWNWLAQMPMLLFVSFVTASYGAWHFDLVILLPGVIHVAALIARKGDRPLVILGVACWLALFVPMLIMNIMKVGSFNFIWVAPAMLVLYLILRQRGVGL